jgi:hypothetical protein
MFETGQEKVSVSEHMIEVVGSIAVDVEVQALDPRSVWYYEASKDHKIVWRSHVNNKGNLKFRMSRTLHETLRRKYVIFLADDGPERGRVQGNLPPSLTSLRCRNDEGTTSKETEDVHEKLGRKTIDGPQLASESVEFCHSIFKQHRSFCELWTG